MNTRIELRIDENSVGMMSDDISYLLIEEAYALEDWTKSNWVGFQCNFTNEDPRSKDLKDVLDQISDIILKHKDLFLINN